ncbi:SCO family protein [Salinicola sp. NYA28a]
MKKELYTPLLVLALMTSSPSFSHSLEDAEAELQERERYAQFVDQPAPAFSLTDTDGNTVSSSDLEESVVVLNFIYSRCQEACPVHMNLIAEVQERVNDTGLRDDVEVSIPRQSRGLYIVSPSKGQESEPPEGGCLTFQT